MGASYLPDTTSEESAAHTNTNCKIFVETPKDATSTSARSSSTWFHLPTVRRSRRTSRSRPEALLRVLCTPFACPKEAPLLNPSAASSSDQHSASQ
eukprot:scaffold394_cov237-Pinguiococcus_pyrenoidosus.AAC.6